MVRGSGKWGQRLRGNIKKNMEINKKSCENKCDRIEQKVVFKKEKKNGTNHSIATFKINIEKHVEKRNKINLKNSK